MYKLRTMHVDAERSTGPMFTQERDTRIFPFGQFLRLHHIDEFPQLVNVLFGDMSLIGPRPERPEFARKLQKEIPLFEKRFAVRAGITGLAQVSAGYADCIRRYRRKVALDALYIDHCSFLLDLRIALRTVAVFFRRTGAR